MSRPSEILAIVVRQPWASLIALGLKPLELRGRRLHHRGDLLIVAGKALDPAAVRFPELDMPLGVSVAIVDLVDCRAARPSDANAACVERIDVALWPWALVFADPRQTRRVSVRGLPGYFYVPRPELLTLPR